ncbi:MAG TPA: hypothetical protein VD813_10120 [Pseudonocardia sp.]|nr:hypothetical protein [Pseudonocardia sp.]
MTAVAEHCVSLIAARGVDPGEAYRLVRAVVAQVVGEAVTRHGAFDELGTQLVMEGLWTRLDGHGGGAKGR